MVVAFARTLENEPDIDRYYRFGSDLPMCGVFARWPTAASCAEWSRRRWNDRTQAGRGP
jgi:hypothetical protein